MNKKQLIICLLLIAFATSGFSQVSRDFFSGVTGDEWRDTGGNIIQAHGGQVSKIGNKWYWVGENRGNNRDIKLYSSDDLYNWTNEGSAMRVVPNNNRAALDNDEYFVALYGHLSKEEKDLVYDGIRGNRVIERPKLIHNRATGKYIIWFHADDSNYGFAGAGIAIADEVTGPYTFIKRKRLHQLPANQYGSEWYEAAGNRGMARDMNLFVDDDDTAYIIYSSEENRTMFISRLNDEYTDLDVLETPVGLAQNGVDFVRLFPGAQREAPAMFKYNGKYYLITSGATGWDPNQAQYWMADDILGAWRNMGDPCINAAGLPHPANKTFDTQSTAVIPLDPEHGKFIYMGDRWNGGGSTNSRYVWLPVYFKSNGGIELRSIEKWNLSLFDVKYENFSELYFSTDELPETVEVQLFADGEWNTADLPVTWNTIDVTTLPPASPKVANGTFEVNGETQIISAKVVNIPENLLYFIDCGATKGSDLYDAIINKGAAPYLINGIYDQAFNANDGWGYTGKIGTDIDYRNPDSKEAFTSGWWAYGNKTIDYKLGIHPGQYRLAVGFQEWWDTGRNMRISLLYKDIENQNKTQVLGDFYNRTESTQDYTFNLDDLNVAGDYITVRVEKTGNPDPLVSWLSLTSLDLLSSIDTVIVLNHTPALKIYPNPVAQAHSVYLEIDAEKEWWRDADITLRNISGQIVKQQAVTCKRSVIDLTVPAGVYILHVKDKQVKLIVK
jgi:hypothetical protein